MSCGERRRFFKGGPELKRCLTSGGDDDFLNASMSLDGPALAWVAALSMSISRRSSTTMGRLTEGDSLVYMSFTSSSLSSRKSLWGEDREEDVRGVVGNDERGTSDSTPAIWMSSPSSSELAKKGPGGGLEGICILKRVSSWESNASQNAIPSNRTKQDT